MESEWMVTDRQTRTSKHVKEKKKKKELKRKNILVLLLAPETPMSGTSRPSGSSPLPSTNAHSCRLPSSSGKLTGGRYGLANAGQPLLHDYHSSDHPQSPRGGNNNSSRTTNSFERDADVNNPSWYWGRPRSLVVGSIVGTTFALPLIGTCADLFRFVLSLTVSVRPCSLLAQWPSSRSCRHTKSMIA